MPKKRTTQTTVAGYFIEIGETYTSVLQTSRKLETTKELEEALENLGHSLKDLTRVLSYHKDFKSGKWVLNLL